MKHSGSCLLIDPIKVRVGPAHKSDAMILLVYKPLENHWIWFLIRTHAKFWTDSIIYKKNHFTVNNDDHWNEICKRFWDRKVDKYRLGLKLYSDSPKQGDEDEDEDEIWCEIVNYRNNLSFEEVLNVER